MNLSLAAEYLPATVRDPQKRHTETALYYLILAQRARQSYASRLHYAIATYGDVDGNPTAGCYGPHFPDGIKTKLRADAHAIGDYVEIACTAWRHAGRRQSTLQPYLEQARRLDDGRRSYY